MTGIVKYIVRFILLIFVQVFVLDRIHLHQMITPYLYFLFIIWLPFKMPRMALMLVASAASRFSRSSLRTNCLYKTLFGKLIIATAG